MPKGSRAAETNRARALDISGLRCHYLTVIGPTEEYSGPARLWLCHCDCGRLTKQKSWWLRKGRVKSCGCKTRSIISAARTRHGETDSRTWKSWKSMHDRCYLKNHKSYGDYGGRGITVCEQWFHYEQFKQDMGERPAGHTLGRMDNLGNYGPMNCRWETPVQQARNRRSSVILTFGGSSKPLVEWAQLTGLGYAALAKRIANGWPVSESLCRPPKPQKNTRCGSFVSARELVAA